MVGRFTGESRSPEQARSSAVTTKPVTAARNGSGADWYLRVVVFTSGSISIGAELAASRLLAPFFGTSLFIWANVIGLTLIYLSIGYAVGGRIADRYPSATVLYGVTAVAAFTIGLVPLLSRPILARSLEAFQALSLGGTLILFAVPVTLLGCVSPFAVRLSMTSLEGAGSTAGSLYALSIAGSIAGTFIPTLLLIPMIGTYRTFYLFALALLSVSLVGLVRMPARRSRMRLIVAAALMLGSMFAVTGFGYRGFV